MSRRKTLNLTKLKSSSDKIESNSRKQVTISKFFSSSFRFKDRTADVDVVTDENVASNKTSSSVSEKKVHSPVRKRQRLNDNNGKDSSPRRRCDNENDCLSFTSQNIDIDDAVVASNKHKKEDNDMTCSTTSLPVVLSSTYNKTRQLCDSTLSKLKQFQQSNVEKKGDISLQDLKHTCTSKRNSHFTENSSKFSEVNDENEVTVISDDENVEISLGSVDESLPSSSHQSRSKLAKFSKSCSVSSTPEFNKRTKSKYTPLELQYLEIKNRYPDTLLFVECGYKYRFFGDDAEIAAKVLKIFCHIDHNFMTASIPTHRLFVHIRRLVAAGYKVGVVKQTETAALKAVGDNKSAPFSRQLTALYTKSTLIGEDVDPLSSVDVGDTSIDGSATLNSFLMCVYDAPPDKGSKLHKIGIMAVQPSTGEVLYDCFDDTDMRGELETRVCHIQPVEILIPQSPTDGTEKLINRMVSISDTVDDRMRVEKMDDTQFVYNKAFDIVSNFYTSQELQDNAETSRLQDVVNLPRPVLSCLACLINYLTEFHLQKVLKVTSNFTQFSITSTHMQLPGNTVRNLELFQNLTDGREMGSLFWMMNQTVTKFGGRLLKTWLAKPLLLPKDITERQEAVLELMTGQCALSLKKLRVILSKMPDLEKGLCSIYHKKCSVQEFFSVCKAFDQLVDEIKPQVDNICQQTSSKMLQQIIRGIPELLHDVHGYCSAINPQAVKENDKTNLFTDETQFPAIVQRKGEITDVLTEIKAHRREVRLLLRIPALEYVTVMGTEFLIEVKNTNLKLVPSDWIKMSSTKAVSRYHSPFIEKKYKKLNQLREQLKMDSNEAWMEFLEWFGTGYQRFKKAVHHLATLDCFFSLAAVAEHHGYCRPEIIEDEVCIEIENGKHPMIHQLINEHSQYVPNDTHLSTTKECVMIITGPNMGGKSSYIKQVALITILAQTGSFVPADSAKMGIVDAIYTRMGAFDEIYKGRSTFMVELQEASHVMAKATSRSLVILDELGRGTSTHDGVAIAFASLDYFIRVVKCFTLFVTHYPMMAEFEKSFPDIVKNYHMAFLLDDTENQLSSSSSDSITFLYQLVYGVADRSYGMNVARLANIPNNIIDVAMEKSHALEAIVEDRRSQRKIFQALCTSTSEEMVNIFQEFQTETASTS